MKECPKCGKWNFTSVEQCTGCGELLQTASRPVITPSSKNMLEEPLPVVYEQPQDPAASKGSMHWFWAALIMMAIRYAGGWIAGRLAGSNPYNISYDFLFAADMAIVYFSLWVWVKLTVNRYFRSGAWTFFMYLWLIVGPIYTSGSYMYPKAAYGNGDTSSLLIFSLLCSIIGPFFFASFRKRNLYRLQEEPGRSETGVPISTPSRLGMHWAFAMLIMLGISYGSELIEIVNSKALPDEVLTILTWIRPYLTFYPYILTPYATILSGISLWVWVKLTARRYGGTRQWNIFTCTWIAVSRFISISSIHLILAIIQFKPGFSDIISDFLYKFLTDILYVLLGFIAFTIHRNNKKARETH